MSDTNNGGPAFPRDHASDGHNGMTLRDYFAAKAMAAFISVPAKPEDIKRAMLKAGVDDALSLMAWNAYNMADEMLKARLK